MPASQVEVQAPPGLEMIPGAGTIGLGGFAEETSEETLRLQAQAEQELKDELVREVTAAVREHIDIKTTAAVDSLWGRGQKAIEYLQKQQMTQSEHLRAQLAACAESYRKLEQENALLRSGLEALMKHLTMAFGPPPHMQGSAPFFPQSPQVPVPSPPAAAPAAEPPAAAPAAATAPAAAQVGMPKPSTVGVRGDTEDFHTPAASPQRTSPADDLLCTPQLATQQLPHVPGFPAAAPETPAASAGEATEAVAAGTPSGGTGSEPAGTSEAAPSSVAAPPSHSQTAGPAGNASPAPPFSLTLRRADNVPLGLDVRGDSGEACLIVEAVRPGGAIEAWNRQCAGDTREIRTGDRIVKINSAEDADSMREQCLTKHLLKMTVQRGSVGEAERASSGLRADADEFVPQASLS